MQRGSFAIFCSKKVERKKTLINSLFIKLLWPGSNEKRICGLQVTISSNTIYFIAAFLPQKISNNFVKAERKREVELNKSIFEWVPKASPGELGWDLPRYVNASTYDELPALLKKSIIRKETRESDLAEAALNGLLTWMKGKRKFPDSTSCNSPILRKLFMCSRIRH